MLALTLSRRETIVIDTPEGDVQIRLCPVPRIFNVATRPGQSIHTEPVAESELEAHGGAKNWVVLESAAGRVRIRRAASKRWAKIRASASDGTGGPAKESCGDVRQADASERMPSRCHLIIDAPRWMRIWREPTEPAEGPRPAAEG